MTVSWDPKKGWNPLERRFSDCSSWRCGAATGS